MHLEEFAVKEKLHFYEIDTNKISKMYCIAFIIVDEKQVLTLRDTLQPHRGEVK